MRTWCADAARLEAVLALRAQVARLVRQHPRAWVLKQKIGQMLGAQVVRLDCCGRIVGFDTSRAACALGGCFGTTRAACALGALAPLRLVHVCPSLFLDVCAACHVLTLILVFYV